MQRVGTLTVIRGNGGVNAFMDGVLNDEIRRQQEADRLNRQKAAEWTRHVENRCGRLLREKLDSIDREPSKADRIRERIGFVLGCLIAWAEALGFIEYVSNSDSTEARRIK